MCDYYDISCTRYAPGQKAAGAECCFDNVCLDDRELYVQASVCGLWCRQVRLLPVKWSSTWPTHLPPVNMCVNPGCRVGSVGQQHCDKHECSLACQCRDGGHALRRNADHPVRKCADRLEGIPPRKTDQNAEDHFLQ